MSNHSGKPKSFSEIAIGDKAEFEVTITEGMHDSFSKLSGDFSPIHCDDRFCSKTNFKKKIGYAFLLTTFLSRLYGEYLPGGSSICIKQDATFIKPFFIGDKIRVVGAVTDKTESTKFVEISTEMFNNEGVRIFRGIGIVQVALDKVQQQLFHCENQDICQGDFVDALRTAGIKNGDTIFVHSDISVFGKLATTDRESLLGSLVNAIKESVGEKGTVIMPAFTYSFCNGEVYDVLNTKSTVGTLTEYFRHKEGVERTRHPIFSAAVWGRHKKELLACSRDSFDQASIFGKLHKLNGKIVFLGAPFQSCTFVHYVEQMHGVPYRYIKTFRGKVRDGNNEYEDECTYLVRYLDRNVNSDFSRFERHLLDNGMMKEQRLGNGRIMVVESGVFFKQGCMLLDKDINFFLKEAPNK